MSEAKRNELNTPSGSLKFFEDGWRRAYQKRERFDSFSDAFDFSKCWERWQRGKFLQDNTPDQARR